MISKALLISAIISLLSFFSFGQVDYDATESIHFAAGASGSRHEVINTIRKHIKSKDYDSVAQMLESTSVSEKFMAAIVCEILAKDGKIELTEIQLQMIEEIKQSNEKLLFRSGCTCQEMIRVNEYFEKKNPCNFRSSVRRWKRELKKMYD